MHGRLDQQSKVGGILALLSRLECRDAEFSSTRPNLRRSAACSLQNTTARNKPRSGWLRSLYNLFGVGKQQEAVSILAAVRAAKPVGHTRADRAGIKRWQTRGSIEHEDLAL